ncbi:WXG100 family type VII secretion target [Nocardia sp. NPDC002869]|uniref:WXG100 family type VII secretion target n=1 Tax=Nocardia sp. NPDC002869 TaxID=3161032 RepID=UPI00398D6458
MVSANPAIFQANPDDLIAIAKKMNGPLQNLERHLKDLTSIQGTLETAFKGNAGQAVYNAFGNVHSTGTGIARYLEDIMAQINQASSKFDEDDRAAFQQVKTAMGDAADGSFNTGVKDGGWQSDAQESTVGPPKAKVDWV